LLFAPDSVSIGPYKTEDSGGTATIPNAAQRGVMDRGKAEYAASIYPMVEARRTAESRYRRNTAGVSRR
jgi:hypothetical protein